MSYDNQILTQYRHGPHQQESTMLQYSVAILVLITIPLVDENSLKKTIAFNTEPCIHHLSPYIISPPTQGNIGSHRPHFLKQPLSDNLAIITGQYVEILNTVLETIFFP